MVRYKEFRVGDIFSVKHVQKMTLPGKAYVMDKEIISEDGKTPYIAAISRNNGITGYSNYPPNNKGDCVTLSTTADSSNTVFYQQDDFIGRQQIAEVRRKDGKPFGRSCGLYVATVIRGLTRQFNYANKLTVDYLQQATVSLPVTTIMMPDWAMLETLLKVHGGGAGMSKIDTSSWKKFKIKDLFDVKKGKRLTQADMIPGHIKFVGATSANNGETARIGNTEHVHVANTITVTYNGSVGEVFYQDEPFWASDDVNVLYPKFEMTEAVALFLIPVIQKLRGKYSYTQKWVKEALENDEIALPVIETDVPDWDLMEQYIRAIEKLVIRDVVDFKDAFIANAKLAVAGKEAV